MHLCTTYLQHFCCTCTYGQEPSSLGVRSLASGSCTTKCVSLYCTSWLISSLKSLKFFEEECQLRFCVPCAGDLVDVVSPSVSLLSPTTVLTPAEDPQSPGTEPPSLQSTLNLGPSLDDGMQLLPVCDIGLWCLWTGCHLAAMMG